jgi:hypothetical protein
MKEAAPSSFEKCLNDHNLWRWSEEIQINILVATLRLMDLIMVKLHLLLEPPPSQADGDTTVHPIDADDAMVPLLRSLTLAFDRTSVYHQKHKDSPLPLTDEASGGRIFAAFTPRTPSKHSRNRTEGTSSLNSKENVKIQSKETFPWLSYLINYFGNKGGFDLLHQVRRFRSLA